jgi:hypothetical protein
LCFLFVVFSFAPLLSPIERIKTKKRKTNKKHKNKKKGKQSSGPFLASCCVLISHPSTHPKNPSTLHTLNAPKIFIDDAPIVY